MFRTDGRDVIRGTDEPTISISEVMGVAVHPYTFWTAHCMVNIQVYRRLCKFSEHDGKPSMLQRLGLNVLCWFVSLRCGVGVRQHSKWGEGGFFDLTLWATEWEDEEGRSQLFTSLLRRQVLQGRPSKAELTSPGDWWGKQGGKDRLFPVPPKSRQNFFWAQELYSHWEPRAQGLPEVGPFCPAEP